MLAKLIGATWVTDIDEVSIVHSASASAVARAREAVRSGAVLTLVESRNGQSILAVVEGHARARHHVAIRRAGAGWHGDCTCAGPVNCEHVITTLLQARVGFGVESARPISAWEKALAPLTTHLTEGERDMPSLALEVTVFATSVAVSAHPPLPVTIRPLRRGAKGSWVKSGVTWSELSRSYGTTFPARPDHVALMTEILALRPNTPSYNSSYGYHSGGYNSGGYNSGGYGLTELAVADLGPGIWPLLARAVRLGVELVSPRDEYAVRVDSEALSLAVDLDRVESGPTPGLLVAPALIGADGVPVSGLAQLLGAPMHGVALVQGRELTLRPLAAPPPAGLSDIMRLQTPIVIPAADEARFLALYYPQMVRRLSVLSTSGTVTLPEITPPRLGLDVVYGSGHAVSLSWHMRYGVPGTDGVKIPLAGGDATGIRDAVEERRAIEGIVGLPEFAQVPELRSPSPTGWRLAPQVALHGFATALFTERVLPSLQERADLDVDVTGEPAEYAAAQSEPLVELRLNESGDVDWFDLAVTVTVDGEPVPLTLLLSALVRGESTLLLDSGTYFSLDRPALEKLRQLVDEARELVDVQRGTLRLSWQDAGLWEQLVELGVVREQSQRWQERIEALLACGAAVPPAPPAGLAATLRPYQQDGFTWLSLLWDASLGGILADDMGLGKTMQTLAMILRAKDRGDLDHPVLVITPTSVIGTWADEARTFAPGLRVATVTETLNRRGQPLADVVADADLVITSYTLVRLDEDDYRAVTWRGVVLDEAQFVKNYRAKTYQCVRRLKTPFTLAISGTPLENSLMDLWALLSLTAPGLFPTPESFSERYRKPIEAGTGAERLVSMRQRMRPFVMRRTKDQVERDLPPKQEQVLSVALAPAHQRIYDRHLQRERQRVLGLLADADHHRIEILAALTRLRQLSLDPGLVDPAYAGKASPAKVDLLVEHLHELSSRGHRALVFSQFTRFLTSVQERLAAEGIETVYLDGKTAASARAARIRQFRTGTAPVFLISLKAGGFGLTLTEADYVFVLDPWWNPAVESQAIDRTHRIGQTKNVMVYRLVSEGTIEEKVRALQERKRHLFDQVVDDGAVLSSAIGADELRELLTG